MGFRRWNMSDYEQGYDYEFEDTQKDKYLTFSIEKENYGIEIQYVTEIIGLQKITEVPNQPNCLSGVINLRGQIIPTMDVRRRFNMPELDYDDRTCIIVLEVHDLSVGIIVDRVLEVMNIDEAHMSPPPTIMDSKENKICKGNRTDR